jgi:hypothetical protein
VTDGNIGREAAIPNPALASLGWLIGMWNTVGTHPLVPGTVFHGRTSIDWLAGGAFLRMRSEIDEPDIPSGIAIIGSDDAVGQLTMLYFDERGVSRRYEVAVGNGSVTWWRDAPGFSQRFTCTLAENGHTFHGQGRLSRDGSTWEGDLELTYTRAGS